MTNTVYSPIVPTVSSVFRYSMLTELVRSFYRFDGVDDYAVLPYRAINIDGDLDIRFRTGPVIPAAGGADRTVISQCLTATFANKEFSLYFNAANGALQAQVGGTYFASAPQVLLAPNTRYRWTMIGGNQAFYVNGVLIRQDPISRGTSREPTAQTVLMAQTHGSPTTFRAFGAGIFFDIEINGVLWQMADRNQVIQLPSPAGLGAELITNGSNIPSNGWTYSNFILTADNVSQFATSGAIPVSVSGGTPYLLQFEVESLTPGGVVRVRIVGGTTIQIAQVNSIGSYRAIVTAAVGNGSINFQSQGSGVMSCVIKNISFRPLYTTNAAQLVTNGDFSAGATRWTVGTGASIANGELTINNPTTSSTFQSIATSNSEWYEVTYTIKSISSGEVRFILYGTGTQRLGTARTTAGTYTEAVRLEQLGGSFNNTISIQGSFLSATNAVIDNVSVRKIDSICNPMQMINTTSDRWREIDK